MNRYNQTNRNAQNGLGGNTRQALSRAENINPTKAPNRIMNPSANQNAGQAPVQDINADKNDMPNINNLYNIQQNANQNSHSMQDMPVVARPSLDRGPEPYVFNIAQETMQNRRFRTTLWTGKYMQLTVMSIPPRGEIGLEQHNNLDQFICIEQGRGLVEMGRRRDSMDFQRPVGPNTGIIIPAGTWHNLYNTGRSPLKLYSLYAPPAHPKGTIHQTREEAEAEERTY